MTTPTQLPSVQRPAVMPFEFRDLVRHCWTTLAVFMVFVVVWAAVVAVGDPPDVSVYVASQALTYSGVIGVCALMLIWIFAPLGWGLGHLMGAVRSPALHSLAFGLLGGLVGALLATTAFLNGAPVEAGTVIPVGLASGFSAAVGRIVAYRRRQVAEAKAVVSPA